MRIKRIQIEDGFLNGFDLKLKTGLNVLIGARGTGKTSVIELIRYALNSKSHTVESEIRSIDHARAVLSGGEVAVTLTDDERDLFVSRSATDEEPVSTERFLPPIILSQTEIETLGLSETGRLSLLDGFLSERSILSAGEARAVSSVKSTYKEIISLEKEITALSDANEANAPKLQSQLAFLVGMQDSLKAGSKDYEDKEKQLKTLNEKMAVLAISDDMLTRFQAVSENWNTTLSILLSNSFGLDVWDGLSEDDPLSQFRDKFSENESYAKKLSISFQQLSELAEERRLALKVRAGDVDKSSRAIRSELERFAEGAGTTAKNISNIRLQLAQIQSKKNLIAERSLRLKALRERRDQEFEELESIRTERFSRRLEVAFKISKGLNPHVKISVERSAHYVEYIKSLTNALRGSGIKYNDLTTTLALKVSPKELVDFCESKDFSGLAELCEIPKDRALRLITQLNEFGMAEVITSNIEDNVTMTLLDGVEYKDISTLSAGQRCTVILSIVLQHKERTLVIDQPEDHLDNAFIASTVIKSLRDRKSSGQVILSTHNANIPVLGDADLVIELTSDGRHGYIQLAEPLAHPDAVRAITNVMEGGRDAFLLRSKFYSTNFK